MHAAVLESVPEVSRWLPWCHAGYSREDADSFIAAAIRAWADGTQYQIAIFDCTDGAYIGAVGINHISRTNRMANLGYWVCSSRTGQGIAVAAVHLAARHAFGALGLSRLEIACIPGNTRSRRVAEKAGAAFEAIARNRIVMYGRAHDAALYSLVPDRYTL